MIYCMSDIHGRIDLFNKMLDQINLKNGDMLYIIGDCIDRGGGLKVLRKIKELSDKGMATLLMGNHEIYFLYYMQYHVSNQRIEKEIELAYEYEKKQKELSKIIQKYDKERTFSGLCMGLVNLYKEADYAAKVQQIAGNIEHSIKNTEICSLMEEWETYKDLEEFSEDESMSLMDFLDQNKKNKRKEIVVNDKHFLLVHGGFTENEDDCLDVREEFYNNPVDKELLQKLGYSSECTVIFGHTTTRDINVRLNHKYIAPHKIWYDERYGDKIGIDCAASYPNGQLACLRLDDMKEFYVKNEEKFITPISKINWCFDTIKEKTGM